ncbi:peptide deformylase [Eubacterium sp.]|uniref:peptide deformylase n=1 Tax=Eubacterium sp. TaxID=142586 RepID=UPI002FC9027E
MAIRNMRVNDDPILHKKAREIPEVNDRIRELAQDMLDTMYDQEGVGLAGPQVGILKRIVVIDVGEGPVVMINPEIVSTEGSIVEDEACLSFPDQSGPVERPECAVARYTDLEGNRCEIEGHELMARAICHELDHLDGVVFLDRVIPQ